MKKSWDLFKAEERSRDPSFGIRAQDYGYGSYTRVDRTRLHTMTERSIVASLYTKIAIDASAIPIKHVRVNQNGIYQEEISSSLNECLTVSANLDQTGREFIMDCVLSMLDEGCVAIVPVETTVNPMKNNAFDVISMRTGKITEFFPKHVKIELYNEWTGSIQEIVMEKEKVCIIENPFYAVMNEPNSTLKRLITKLSLLDTADKANASSKLNLLVQLPYAVKTPFQKQRAEERRTDLEKQINESEHGIAYIDSSEKVTQLGRAIDNNLLGQVDNLTSTLHNQLGVTEKVFDGTADEQTMLNYYNSTIEPILSAIVDEMTRKFLTKTARTQRQRIMFIRDPFRLIPVANLADIADRFTRNEIASSNEMRAVMGLKPVGDTRADELRNKNLNQNNLDVMPVNTNEEESIGEDDLYSLSEEELEAKLADMEDFIGQLDDMEEELDNE